MAAREQALLGIFENFATFLRAEFRLAARRKSYGFRPPRPSRQRVAPRCLPGRLHRPVDAVAQQRPLVVLPVVVLAGIEVAGAAGEIDLEDLGVVLLGLLPG